MPPVTVRLRTSTVDYLITAAERAAFKRCRRQWDLGSPHRRDLEPTRRPDATTAGDDDLVEALKEALAMYYYPGSWDWPRQIVRPLVYKAFLRSVEERAIEVAAVEAGTALLESYIARAPELDEFSPIKIDHDAEGPLPDPRRPGSGLMTADKRRMVYSGRIDLLAVDATDAYWVVRHQLVPDWPAVELALLDEEAVAACWAWEQVYLGMEIAGTVHNQLRTLVTNDSDTLMGGEVRRVAQHEPSGGGRSIPQHRRLYARAKATEPAERVTVRSAGPIRRVQVRRSRAEVEGAGHAIGTEALEMFGAALYPTPAGHCVSCPFSDPCSAMNEGADAEAMLAADFRRRPDTMARRARLGQSTWGYGRGAVPPPHW